LQSRFGDAGRGYTLIAKPWAWYGHRGVEISDHGWKMRTGVGLMREGIYGLGGAAFEGKPGAWSKFQLTESQQTAVDVEYLAKPGGGAFAVEADDQRIVEQTTAPTRRQPARFMWNCLPEPRVSPSGPLRERDAVWRGLSPRDERLALRQPWPERRNHQRAGARVAAGLWKQELDRAAPALVVVNYGSNESSFGAFVHKQYAAELRLAIQRIRQARSRRADTDHEPDGSRGAQRTERY
jgi:hypothetical protein